MSGRVRIDAYPESAWRYLDRRIVCVDVMNSCTVAVTAAAQDRVIFPAADITEAVRLAGVVPGALIAGQLQKGERSSLHFDLASSPAALAWRTDKRPLVLLDPPGTRLIANCQGARDMYVACLRNLSATVDFLASDRDEVVVLAAGDGDDFRCEDRMAAARIAHALVARGFTAEGQGTAELIERWAMAEVSLLRWGRSAERLRRLGRSEDLEYILGHVDDLSVVCRYQGGRLAATRLDMPEAPEGPSRERGEVVA